MNIDQLRQQVESAIALFTLVDERNVRFCQDLLESLKAIERKHLERRADMGRLEEQVEQLTQENQQLRALLQSLLVAVGAGRHSKHDEIKRRLEKRISRLAQTSGPTGSDAEPARDQVVKSFTAPDDDIEEIVARIGRTTATKSGLVEEPAQPDAQSTLAG